MNALYTPSVFMGKKSNRFTENNEIKEVVSMNIHGKQWRLYTIFREYSRKNKFIGINKCSVNDKWLKIVQSN